MTEKIFPCLRQRRTVCDGRKWYPAFQFGEDGRPLPIIAELLEILVHEIEQLASTGTPSLRGLVIAAPQPSDGLALSLAPRGIMLIVGNPLDPLPALLDRFKRQLNVIRAADRQGVWQAVLGRRGIATSSSAEMTRPRTESPYAQRPPGFNQAAYDAWMKKLAQPWHEEDAWKFDT